MDPRTLREATHAEHEATEALMPLMTPELSREVYVKVLQVLLPLLTSWEQWAGDAAEGRLRVLLESRRRSHLLAADLDFFGARLDGGAGYRVNWDEVITGETGARAAAMEAASFRANLLGAIYVLEGSTLGGRFLAKHVEQVLGLEAGVGDSYFQGHGQATGAMWREVLAEIGEVPDEDADLTIGCAKRTFGAFREALLIGLSAQQTVQG